MDVSFSPALSNPRRHVFLPADSGDDACWWCDEPSEAHSRTRADIESAVRAERRRIVAQLEARADALLALAEPRAWTPAVVAELRAAARAVQDGAE